MAVIIDDERLNDINRQQLKNAVYARLWVQAVQWLARSVFSES
jgi:hypothetical protein